VLESVVEKRMLAYRCAARYRSARFIIGEILDDTAVVSVPERPGYHVRADGGPAPHVFEANARGDEM
jgi:hypothetical protein